MQRREVVTGLGMLAVAGCAREKAPADVARDRRQFDWRVVTTWPPNFPGLGTGVNDLVELVEGCSGGRLKIRVYGANELVPAFEAFDAVAGGTAEMAHGAAYYWKGKVEAAPFFSAMPFGFTAQEMNAWLYYGGGWELWQEAYAPFGILPVPCGNTGCQMGGWFRREIRSLADLKGLKMRIPGLGGEVLARAGGTPVTLSGGEIFTALETGAIDATEWIGPYNDLAFGLHKAAKYYYYPGWHEPGSALEALVSRKAFDDLPQDLQQILLACCRAINGQVLAEFTARNAEALETLVREHGVQVRRFPDDVLSRLRAISAQVIEETAARDPLYARVYASVRAFQERSTSYLNVAEAAYLAAREL